RKTKRTDERAAAVARLELHLRRSFLYQSPVYVHRVVLLIRVDLLPDLLRIEELHAGQVEISTFDVGFSKKTSRLCTQRAQHHMVMRSGIAAPGHAVPRGFFTFADADFEVNRISLN